MLQLYFRNLNAMKPSHYGTFKDLRKEINYLDFAILLYFYISRNNLTKKPFLSPELFYFSRPGSDGNQILILAFV
ncbi:hypothetical protein YC2023_117251 [Brassica napus]